MVSIIDFDQTLSIEHTFGLFQLGAPFFDEEGNPGRAIQQMSAAFYGDPRLSDRLILLMSSLAENPVSPETWKKLGKLHANFNLKRGIPLERLQLFAIATHHNNPDFIAGYMEELLGKTLTPVVEEPLLSQGKPQVAIKRFEVEGEVEPLCISYLPDTGSAFRAKRGSLHGKNEQIEFIKETVGIDCFHSDDLIVQEYEYDLQPEERVRFYDDDPVNCATALLHNLVDDVYLVERQGEGFSVSAFDSRIDAALINVEGTGLAVKGELAEALSNNEKLLMQILLDNPGKQILRKNERGELVETGLLLGEPISVALNSRDSRDRLEQCRSVLEAREVLQGPENRLLTPHQVHTALLAIQDKQLEEKQAEEKAALPTVSQALENLRQSGAVIEGLTSEQIKSVLEANPGKILLRPSSQPGDVTRVIYLMGGIHQDRLSESREFRNQLAEATTPAGALSIVDGKRQSVLRPEQVRASLERSAASSSTEAVTNPARVPGTLYAGSGSTQASGANTKTPAESDAKGATPGSSREG